MNEDYDDWPIKFENQSDLFDLSMYSFNEVFKKYLVLKPYGNESSPKILRWKVGTFFYASTYLTSFSCFTHKEINTWHTGKCFTFFGDEIKATFFSTISLELNNVFENGNGKFKVFLHDRGMEFSLINQV